MVWVITEDGLPYHRKFLRAGPDGYALWHAGLSWSNLHRANGRLPKDLLDAFYPSPKLRGKRLRRAAECLVDVRLWDDEGDHWAIHNYAKRQHRALKNEGETAIEVRREGDRRRQQKSRDHHKTSRSPSRDETVTSSRAGIPNPTQPNPTQVPPNPPSPGVPVTVDDVGEFYRLASGNTDLCTDPTQWTHQLQQAALIVLRWANRQAEPTDSLIAQYKLGAEDEWLCNQPFHIWAPRMGTLGKSNGAPQSASERRDDREDRRGQINHIASLRDTAKVSLRDAEWELEQAEDDAGRAKAQAQVTRYETKVADLTKQLEQQRG